MILVHRVLAASFAKLDAKTLAAKEETAITGLLVDQMRSLLESRVCPRGAEHFSVHDDRPESHTGVEGKSRPRVDIYVERTGVGPRPRFHFEAKRLSGSGSVAAYVGVNGMGCFLSGKYAKGDPDAGMLGYVQCDEPTDWAVKIATKLANDRAAHALHAPASDWVEVTLAGSLPRTYLSAHTRAHRRFEIFHVLLRCR